MASSVTCTLTSSFFMPGSSAIMQSFPPSSFTSTAGAQKPADGIVLPLNMRSISSVNRLIKVNGLISKKLRPKRDFSKPAQGDTADTSSSGAFLPLTSVPAIDTLLSVPTKQAPIQIGGVCSLNEHQITHCFVGC